MKEAYCRVLSFLHCLLDIMDGHLYIECGCSSWPWSSIYTADIITTLKVDSGARHFTYVDDVITTQQLHPERQWKDCKRHPQSCCMGTCLYNQTKHYGCWTMAYTLVYVLPRRSKIHCSRWRF